MCPRKRKEAYLTRMRGVVRGQIIKVLVSLTWISSGKRWNFYYVLKGLLFPPGKRQQGDRETIRCKGPNITAIQEAGDGVLI